MERTVIDPLRKTLCWLSRTFGKTKCFFVLCMCLVAGFAIVADGPLRCEAQSLDEQLFEGLADSIVEGAQVDEQRSLVEKDQQRLQRYQKTVQAMLRLQGRLSAGATASETQELQAKVLVDIDRLIAALQSQRSGPPSGNMSVKETEPSASTRVQRSKDPVRPTDGVQPALTLNGEPADRSTATVQQGDGRGVTVSPTEARDRLLQSSWGSLPPGLRRQMRSSRPERFHPKYEQLIEAYFQRLAERNQ